MKVTGFLYDQKAREQLKRSGRELMKDKVLICFGSEHYKFAFISLASITFSGALLLLILAMRIGEFYKGDIYKKFKEGAIVAETELASSSVQESEKKKKKNKRASERENKVARCNFVIKFSLSMAYWFIN